MKILAADDEILALEMLTDAIRKAYPEAEFNVINRDTYTQFIR